MGPTCSGKSEIAIKLSEHFSCPIINADAFQIYQDMDIGTAKINKDSPYYKNHYLLDIKTPDQSYNVKEYQNDFRNIANTLLKTYKDIIVVGGTGLYIKAALFDYTFIDEPINDDSIYDNVSNEELYNKLLSLDADSANKIHPNNRKRIIRALDIIKNSSLTKTEIINNQEHSLVYKDVRFLFINPNRDSLYEEINKRVDVMFDKGLVNEVINLKNKYQLSLTAKQGIGYKEVLDYLDNKYTLEECKELIKKRTRNYAKRQVTFFKNQFKYDEFNTKEDLLKELIHE